MAPNLPKPMMNRLDFLNTLTGTATARPSSPAVDRPADPLPAWPLPDLRQAITVPVLIRSVELLKTQGELFAVITSDGGERGTTQCNDRM